jgi:hypothetical protein
MLINNHVKGSTRVAEKLNETSLASLCSVRWGPGLSKPKAVIGDLQMICDSVPGWPLTPAQISPANPRTSKLGVYQCSALHSLVDPADCSRPALLLLLYWYPGPLIWDVCDPQVLFFGRFRSFLATKVGEYPLPSGSSFRFPSCFHPGTPAIDSDLPKLTGPGIIGRRIDPRLEMSMAPKPPSERPEIGFET